MSLEQAIHLRWQNDAPLAALVPIARVFTGKAVGSPLLPYVVLTRQAAEPIDYTSSGTRIAGAVMQFDVIDDDLDDAKAISVEMLRLFDRADFAMTVGTVLNMQLRDQREEMHDDASWCLSIEFDVMTQE